MDEFLFLKGCPFCGSDAGYFEDIRYRNDPRDRWIVYGVKCTNPDCIAHQDEKIYPTPEQAREAWNKRYERSK